ncbi:DUF4394 domain-containing protein [Motilibacter deserti]|uniref:DUF4394 domain-containing protein n=1 Tax=Motilibacter deserti TaxID=2714956 RepID=A0ABX0GST7_9ACTN|nr:DUF4394 domain-containing protein [Motilibacter deserti]NHC12734.1 DUF4394 domain-containing protein [Motilibacter deserti]
MPNRTRTALAAGALAAGLVVTAQPALAAHEGIEVTALTNNNRLLTFYAGDPGTILDSVKIAGLSGETVLGIDYRPADRGLYALLGSSASARVVRLDPDSGRILSGVPLRTAAGAAVIPAGGNVDIDFNPAADRLRIVSDAGENLRVDVTTGVTTLDTALSYAAGAGTGAPRVVAAAYTNNDTDPATGTTLYDLDGATDAVHTQAPPNDGVLNRVGPLGVPFWAQSGFDISTSGTTNVALVALRYRGSTTLSVVDLATGAVNAASTARIGGTAAVVDIAAAPR